MKYRFAIFRAYQRSFQFRLLTALTLISFIFIPAMGYVSYLQGKKTVEKQIRQHSIGMASQIAERIRSFLASPINNVRRLRTFLETGQLDPEDEKGLIRYFHMIQKDHPQFLNINFGDKNGKFIMVPPQRPEIHKLYDPRIRPWYIGALKEKGLFWTDVYVFASSQNPGITVSIPILDPGGDLLGVCSIDIDLSTLSRVLKSIKIGKQGYAYIVEKEHERVIAHPELLRLNFSPERIRFLNSCLNNLMAEGKQFGTTTHKGQDYFTAYTDYPANRWAVAVTMPVSDFLDDINYIKKVTLTMVLAAIMLSGALSYLLAITIVKPLKTLEQGINRVGTGDMDYTLKIHSPDIIGSLAGAFNQMASSLKKSREEVMRTYLELAEKEKLAALGELTAGIAHEIKNPLGIILGSAQVVANKEKPQSMRDQAANFIVEEVVRLNKTLTTFLAFAKPASPKFVPIDLPHLLEETLDSLQDQLGRQHITVVRNALASSSRCRGDREQMRQVFLNLLLNAMQAMPDGGELKVAASLEMAGRLPARGRKFRWVQEPREGRDCMVIEITDTGVGISSQELEKIFDPFVTFKDGGTGLGLSIILQILKLHHAGITVDSREGKGTILTIYFPCGSKEHKDER
ncbi:MAG: cache domain-containing protein [Thermodesulfobacteriota bacterium]